MEGVLDAAGDESKGIEKGAVVGVEGMEEVRRELEGYCSSCRREMEGLGLGWAAVSGG